MVHKKKKGRGGEGETPRNSVLPPYPAVLYVSSVVNYKLGDSNLLLIN